MKAKYLFLRCKHCSRVNRYDSEAVGDIVCSGCGNTLKTVIYREERKKHNTEADFKSSYDVLNYLKKSPEIWCVITVNNNYLECFKAKAKSHNSEMFRIEHGMEGNIYTTKNMLTSLGGFSIISKKDDNNYVDYFYVDEFFLDIAHPDLDIEKRDELSIAVPFKKKNSECTGLSSIN